MVRRILRRLRPSAVVILETEIWPNLYRESKRARNRSTDGQRADFRSEPAQLRSGQRLLSPRAAVARCDLRANRGGRSQSPFGRRSSQQHREGRRESQVRFQATGFGSRSGHCGFSARNSRKINRGFSTRGGRDIDRGFSTWKIRKINRGFSPWKIRKYQSRIFCKENPQDQYGSRRAQRLPMPPAIRMRTTRSLGRICRAQPSRPDFDPGSAPAAARIRPLWRKSFLTRAGISFCQEDGITVRSTVLSKRRPQPAAR